MRRVALLALALAVLPGLARAENLEQFGFGARAQGMGGAFTGLASDATATYYNPGGLVLSKHLNLTFGFSYADMNLEFDSATGGKLDSDAERVQPLSALTIGVSTAIEVDTPDRLAFGMSIFLPTRGVIDLEARATSSTPEWFSYGPRHDRVLAIPALAVKITDWLSFGLGAPVTIAAEGSTRIVGGLTTPVQTQFDMKLDPGVGVIAGALLMPLDWLSFGLTYRSEHSLTLDFPAEAILEGVRLPIVLETEQYFSPHQLQFGIAADVIDGVLLTLDGLWVNWSAYDAPFLEVSSGTVTVVQVPEVDFDDVFSVRAGIEVVATRWLILRGGYWYSSSPVEDQSFKPTNLAGSDKHVFTLGAGLTFGPFEDPESLEEEKERGRAQTWDEATRDMSVDIDVFFQYHLHTGVSATKGAGDPVGNWDADGSIINMGITLTARF